MNRAPLRVLIVDDSAEDAELMVRALERGGRSVAHERVQTEAALASALAKPRWDVVLSDYTLARCSALAALAVLKATDIDLPFIVVSGTTGEETAVAAMKAGAHDFLVKSRVSGLAASVERELRAAEERRRAEQARSGDASDQQRLHEQLRQAQKMEAVGQLAGGVAHDFNNVLTAILGYVGLLTDQIGPDKPIGRDLREIRLAAERAAVLTQQLLAFSRKQVLAVRPLDLSDMVRNLEPMLRRLMPEPIRIETTLADAPDPVRADPTQLEHLLINLAVNGRDAMPNGGTLTIATGSVDLDDRFVAMHPGASPGRHSTLKVTDTGIGMAPDVQRRIFEPFFTTKERGRGTGLGLAAAYGTVKQLRGYIGVDSEPGKGTSFTIYLPRTHEVPQKVDMSVPTGTPVGAETILLVEDESGVRSFARIALQRFGYRVLEAESAESALSLLGTLDGPVDLLLTDVVLPGMDGRELATRVAADRPTTRVLFMSGYAASLRTDDGFLSPGVQMLEKPFSAQLLLTRTRQILGTAPPPTSG